MLQPPEVFSIWKNDSPMQLNMEAGDGLSQARHRNLFYYYDMATSSVDQSGCRTTMSQ